MIPQPGPQEAAILLLSLSAETAGMIFSYLSPQEIQQVSRLMCQLRAVPEPHITEVTHRFSEALDKPQPFLANETRTREWLNKALPGTDVHKWIDDDVSQEVIDIWHLLETCDLNMAWQCLHDESPQMMAVVFSRLSEARVADLLEKLPAEKWPTVLKRMGHMQGIQPQLIADIGHVLLEKYRHSQETFSKEDPLQRMADIISLVPKGQEKLSYYVEDISLRESIQKRIFQFEDFLYLEEDALRLLIRIVDKPLLAMALQDTSLELQTVFLSSLSPRAANLLREEMEDQRRFRTEEAIHQAQVTILQTFKNLIREGQMQLPKKQTLVS